jgi:type I restriction enzyme S subunit
MAGEWKTASLGELCDFRAGSVFKPVLQGQSSGEFPFVKVSDMNLPANAVRIQDANNWVSEADLRELRAKPFPPGTVVFAKIGEALRQNRLRQVARETIVDNNMMGAVPRIDRIDPRFFYYALSQFDFSDIAQGTALPYLTVASLSALSLDVPPPNEQRAIAHILGTLDDKIEMNRRMNETLEAMARALFKSWFVDFDPVRAKAEGRDPGLPKPLADLFPDSFEDSDLGEIPKGWRNGTLGDVAEHPRRGVQPHEIEPTTPYIALEHMPRRSIALSDWGTGDGLESNKFEFKKGEILFGKLRPYFHKVGVAPVDGVCSTDIVVVTPRAQEWFGFVLGHVSSDAFVEHTTAGSTGTKMPRTSWSEMARYAAVIPSLDVAKAFSSHIRPVVDHILVTIHVSHTLAALRDTLLPKLISGELRVTASEAAHA